MSYFNRILDDYFDDENDSDSYDDANESNDPANPIWEGSEVHYNPYGIDPTLPDKNEISLD